MKVKCPSADETKSFPALKCIRTSWKRMKKGNPKMHLPKKASKNQEPKTILTLLSNLGVNISRSPGGRTSLSPNVITTNNNNNNNRNRSSSLVVPPVIRRKGSSGGSPGSKSLHLSPLESSLHSSKSHVTLFTFPEPGNSAETSADSGLSSILHVHERYLSSEDFHEALFFERSPKSGQRKRTRKAQNSQKCLSDHKNSVTMSEKKLSVTQL